MGPVAALLPCGRRLHLQHGPIDLIIGADGARARAFEAAAARFATVLDDLVPQLPALRQPPGPALRGEIAQNMKAAAQTFAIIGFITPMAAVAGAVADAVLAAMVQAADLRRAYVNNGGDIALHLTPGARFETAMADHQGRALGRISLTAEGPVRGIATSGRHGRSLSLGIADSVTVLARSAALADAAATMIAGAVDLPGHKGITRARACDLDPDSDLGTRAVVTGCGPLAGPDAGRALQAGLDRAGPLVQAGHIVGASLHLQGRSVTTGSPLMSLKSRETALA